MRGCMESSFEKMAKKLGLTPQEYESSVELKEWARQNMGEKYVPLYLLKMWGLVDEDAA
jgi:hypothetical protein